jgi:mono/diheme cytochrome c family protein
MKKLIVIGLAVCVIPAIAARAADAKESYEKNCAKCHGSDGKGQTKMGQKLSIKDFTDAKRQEALTDAAALKAIKEGVKDKEDKTLMKPLEGVTDEEAKALVAYVRTFKK